MLLSRNQALMIVGAIVMIGAFKSASAQVRHTLIRHEERPEILPWDHNVPYPIWSGTALLGVELNRTSTPIIWGIARDGRKEEIQFSIPEAGQLILTSIAGSKDGAIAVGGTAIGNDSQGSGFLGIIAPDRSSRTIIRTWPYTPMAVTIAADGVVWTVGLDQENDRRIFNVLKRFDPSGNLLSTTRTTVKGGPGGDASHASKLRASRDLVGWLTAASEYVEFSLDGLERNRFQGPPWHPTTAVWTTLALNDKDDVLTASSGPGQSMWLLDRQKRVWNPVEAVGEKLDKFAVTFGFDGQDLVVGSEAANRGKLIIRYGLPEVN